MTRTKDVVGLVGWVLVSFAAAGIGAAASVGAGSFYLDLARPAWAPPAWVFGPVWTTLYLMMGVAAWLVWRAPAGGFRGARAALVLFLVQLIFNGLWTWIFFAWQLGGLAMVEIVVLWLLITATLLAFWRVRIFAGALLLPYLAWVTYATALTFALWRLNPGVLR